MHDEAATRGRTEAQQPWEVGRSLRSDVGREGGGQAIR
jgi:hypothetical protein